MNQRASATNFDWHDLPLVKPSWLSHITSLFSVCLHGFQELLLHDLAGHRSETAGFVVALSSLLSFLKTGLFLVFQCHQTAVTSQIPWTVA